MNTDHSALQLIEDLARTLRETYQRGFNDGIIATVAYTQRVEEPADDAPENVTEFRGKPDA